MSYNNILRQASFFINASLPMKTIKFRPGEVDDFIVLALQMSGDVKYEYDPKGSTVLFTGMQFIRFIEFLKDVLENDELVTEEEKAAVRSTLAHIATQIPNA